MFSEASFAEMCDAEGELKDLAVRLLQCDKGSDAANAFARQMSETILRRHPFEAAAMLLSTLCELVEAEAKIKDLEEVIASWNNPEQLPDNETTRAIDHFLAHPETGIRRALPARRGGMSGVQIGHGGTQTNVFNENGEGK